VTLPPSVALFFGFGRVGLLGFGGGPSMIPLMQAECVGSGWVSEEQFLDGLALGNTLPGPIATKMAVFVGWSAAGVTGAAAAVAGVVLPSVLLMAALVLFASRWRGSPALEGALGAARPAVIGLLAFVVWELAPGAIGSGSGVLVALAAFIALALRVHPAIVLLGAMALGAAAAAARAA